MGTPILTIYCSHLLTELSSVVEQLAYIQCVGGSIPPVPIWNVWDYSNMPFNLLGQICLPFTVIWFFLSAVAVVLDDWIRHILWGEDIPHYKWR